MAFVVRRPKGRWEIRETVRTDAGPRARSLATFAVFDDGVFTRAQAAARGSLDSRALRAAARRAGAPIAETRADTAARQLLREVAHGRAPTPGLSRLLRAQLGEDDAAVPSAGDGIADWIGASPTERGDALRDLLSLADRLPATRRAALDFPRFVPVPAGA